MPSRLETVVNICGEADSSGWIKHRTFERALILGPAIVAPLKHVHFTHSEFIADLDAMFIEIPDDRHVLGVIGLHSVTFRECRFENIGMIGTRETIAHLRRGIEASSPD